MTPSPPGPDPAFGGAMRQMSRSHIADIWRRGKANEPLTGEDEVFFGCMRQHPEYAELWERAAELADQEIDVSGTNPFLHVAVHSMIEQQIAGGTPAEVNEALSRLVKAGVDRHEAIHRIAGLLSELMWEMLHQGQPFDAPTYERRLRLLRP